MHELAPMIYDLGIMLCVSAIVIVIFQRIRQPVVLGYLVAGMILGPHTPPYSFISSVEDIKSISELGVIFLMFSLGLEFSFHKLMRVGFSATVIGTVEVVFMAVAGYFVGVSIGWSHDDSLILGAALSISSTMIIVKAIDELKLKTKRFSELVFGVLIVEDLLAILMLAALPTMVLSSNVMSIDVVKSVLQLVLVVGAWFIIGYFVVPSLFRQIAKYINAETLTILSVALCLFLVMVATHFHYSAALGAFIMGSIMAETVLIHRIEELIRPIRDIFAAVFFVSVGMLIEPSVMIDEWPLVLLVTLVTIVGKLVSTCGGALLTGQSISTSIRTGFSMAQIGEFSFIIAAYGLAMGVTNNTVYPVIVAVSVITTFTTPYLIRFSGNVSDSIEKKLSGNFKFFLLNYMAWIDRLSASTHQRPWVRQIIMRLIVNGMLVCIIFILCDLWISPMLQSNIASIALAEIIGIMIACLLSAPFIWGMLFSYRSTDIPEFGRARINPVASLIWLFTLIEISMLSIFLFQAWTTTLLMAVIVTMFIVYAYKHVEKSYQWFEQQFVKNIQNQNETNKARYESLAPWDNHLVELHVDAYSEFSNKKLSETKIRDLFDINVVAICRGFNVIPAPRGDELIVANDRLIVLGHDNQIDALRKKLESTQHENMPIDFLEGFVLKPVVIMKNHPFIGKTIREARIRERVNGMVVGMERNGERVLNPDLDMLIQVDDLLLVVGDAEKMRQL